MSANGSVTFSPVYTVSSPTTAYSTGFGLRIHFNSQALQWVGTSARFAYAALPLSAVMSDTDNADDDSTTDSYVLAAWVDSTAQWPGSDELPLTLLQAQFQAVDGFSGTTTIRTSAVATADNTTFSSTAMQVTVGDGVNLQARLWLQGAYDSSQTLMRDDLRSAGLVPLAQPYGSDVGTQTTTAAILATTGNNAPVDWVLLQLRDASTPSTVIASTAALLQADGDVVDATTQSTTLQFAAASAGSYYVSVSHRNHLGVMTAQPLSLSSTAQLVDFTSSATAFYGTEPTTTSGTQRLLWAGDANADAKLIADGQTNDKNTLLGTLLTATDNGNAATNFQLSAYHRADINMDGKVIFAGPNNDLTALLGNVLLFPSNSTVSTNYIVKGTLP